MLEIMARRWPHAVSCASVQARRVRIAALHPAVMIREVLEMKLGQQQSVMTGSFASGRRVRPGRSRVELFMPGVEILAEGDHVNELMVVLGGLVEAVAPAGADREASVRGGVSALGDPSVSVALSQRRGASPCQHALMPAAPAALSAPLHRLGACCR